MKQFKSVKVRKRRRIIRHIFIFFFFFAYVFMVKYCINNKLDKNVLDKDITYIRFNLKDTVSSAIDNAINKPVLFLNNNVKTAVKVETKKTNTIEKKKENKVDEEVSVKTLDTKPLIYVYNTHQTEEYDGYSVYDAAIKLTNMLNDSGLNTIFEEQSVSVFLQKNNLKYYKSYEVSRKYLSEVYAKYPDIKYFIDFHRDSVTKEKSTLTYNDKSYAKILFIVGLDNPSYNVNLENTSKLNQIIETKVPGISRGVMKKGGKGVNGVYNQDISGNLFLIEVGGSYNTKQEVDNSIEVIQDSLIEYIRGVV